ncbi:uncharacterized protein LOC122004358 [Zingiber officinale]|uniref:Uncharacterized protein n=1 Tax=Zingiber officinale TaxID=94328 RepID=A0A8J5KMA7_ZINOF|nr:uncharacterized protein LOC122004358 [Zingiber officinale]KAG6489556.1 hypothetical protein ZIOFF_050831 [Zingiber officinale]
MVLTLILLKRDREKLKDIGNGHTVSGFRIHHSDIKVVNLHNDTKFKPNVSTSNNDNLPVLHCLDGRHKLVSIINFPQIQYIVSISSRSTKIREIYDLQMPCYKINNRTLSTITLFFRTTMNGKKGSSIQIDICLPPNATPQSESMKKSTKDHNGKVTIPMRKLMMEAWEFAKEDTDRVTFSLKVGLACLLVSLLILIQPPYQVFGTNFILEKVGMKK